MRKGLKKFLAIATAATLSAGALSLAACAADFKPLTGDTSGEVVSNGGFVVEKGQYVYFINGVETQESDNTYGKPVKGALMRIKKSSVLGKTNDAEIVIPSLMVAGDYTSGIYLYGERIYYATPNNLRDTSGDIASDHLCFCSAKLDGSDVKDIVRIADRESKYRFVQPKADGPVYLVYDKDDSEIHSVNTETNEDVTLVAGAESFVYNSTDKEDGWIYYTMGVSDGQDTENSERSYDYKQIYRVRADATEAPYEYTWDEDYLKEHDGEAPYTNLGEIVLDGIGQLDADEATQFNHDLEGTTPLASTGYTYTLQSYTNGGIYFTRNEIIKTGSPGEDGWLYYLDAAKVDAEDWNSVSGNAVKKASSAGALDAVALPANTSKANTAAIFMKDGDAHSYLYVANNNIYYAKVAEDGSGTIVNNRDGEIVSDGSNQTGMRIASDVSGATLQWVDTTSSADYKYVYFTRSGNSGGLTVERAVFNGKKENYGNMQSGTEPQKPFESVKVLDVQHASGWYPFEIIDGVLYYADGETFGGDAYTYISSVLLRDGEGKLLDNEEIADFNDKYNALMDTDSKKGYFAKLSADGESNLSTAYKYYFYTADQDGLFDKNIQSAIDEGKREDYLYSTEEQQRFKDYKAGKGDAEAYGETRLRSYFVTKLGTWKEEDKEALTEYWRTTLRTYTPPEEEDTGLEAWEWALIGIAIAIVVAGGIVAAVLLTKRHKKKIEEERAQARPKRMRVDTTDDRSVDVYTPTPAEEHAEESAETPAEEPAEAPAEESAETPAEEPAETPEGPAE